MNISYLETSTQMEAKTCVCHGKNIKIAYSFIDSYHSLCIDKKDIILGQINACERLLKYTSIQTDEDVITREIAELKMALDLLS